MCRFPENECRQTNSISNHFLQSISCIYAIDLTVSKFSYASIHRLACKAWASYEQYAGGVFEILRVPVPTGIVTKPANVAYNVAIALFEKRTHFNLD